MIHKTTKRIFDVIFSFMGLIVLLPFFLLISVLIKNDSSGPVFYKQKRMGLHWKIFNIIKFRTMVLNADECGPSVSGSNDVRITSIGRILRKHKIDELPQLLNVLKGEMSLVGPRPEVPEYVMIYKKEYDEILKVVPGITDHVTLLFKDEETTLQGKYSERIYLQEILPSKIKYFYEYNNKNSIMSYFNIIFRTVTVLIIDALRELYKSLIKNRKCLKANAITGQQKPEIN